MCFLRDLEKKISAKCEKIYLLLLQGMLCVARDESFMVIPKKILLGIDYLSDDIHEIFINIMWELITKVIKNRENMLNNWWEK